MWIIRKNLFTLALLCLLCVLPVGTCSAAETMYLIPDSQLTQLEQNSVTLREKIQKLESTLTQSKTDLTTSKMELEACQIELKALQEKSTTLITESEALKANLEASNKSLTKMTEYINQLEKQVKSKINRLTWQRNLFAGACVYLLVK
ncbi:hypothetical protein SPSIL_015310 [Sporomusa silvacetica DSM 10669]|uniref:IncA protein n=1 Tax=Sporomusa silvacetica DSM 10669 TaxID=1123289 RepID=A0ABZ3IID2_9FIRM|nr:IncA protein [Sporomusa silvacetica DSM 10669]